MGYRPIALALASVLLLGCEAESKETSANQIKPVKISEYQQQLINNQHRFLGEVVAANRTDMSFRVGGELQTLELEMGQRVKQGQIIAQLDQLDYQLALAAKQAQLDLAQTKYSRAKSLFKQKLISQDQYDQSVTQFEVAKTERDQAKTDLAYTTITAPFDGMVSLKYAYPHEVVGAQQPIVTLIETNGYEVRFDVPVTTAQSIVETNFELLFRLDAAPNQPVIATVKESFIRPDTDTNSYQITAVLHDTEQFSMLPGMSGTVEVAKKGVTNSLSLPESSWISLTNSEAKSEGFVWVYDPTAQSVSKRQIEIDHIANTLSGLKDGEMIVTSGVDALKEGQLVRPWVRERGI